jgi:UDP-2-acetamido-3-amino-2,3-dideoxy-glucuronate N-acetyltransferase
MILGVPGRIAGWACECGTTLKFEREEAFCSECGKRYLKTDHFGIARTF